MITSALAFRALQVDGRSRAHPLMLVRHRRNDLEHNRYGISTGRRVGSAVVRNKLRRRLRTILRRHNSIIEPGWDVLIALRPAAATAAQAELEQALLATLARAGLLGERENERPGGAN